MAERCYIGIDLGAESGRVVAGLFDGARIRTDELHRFPNGPVPVAGTLRWNVLGLWSGILDGLARARERFGTAAASVGVDTWGVDYVLLSKSGELFGQPFHYRDARTRGLLAQATARVPRREIFAATGVQFMEINTLYQLLAAAQADRRLLESADRLLLMPDFFHWLLSGSRVVEFTNATTTQCFHPTAGEWSFDLLRRLDLPAAIFPQVVPPGTALGTLREDVAARTGLGRIAVVAPPTHDTAAAVAAVPTERTGRPDWAYISSGTWSLMGVEVRDAVLTDRALVLNVTNEGGIDGTYRLLKNIMGLWLVQQCRRSFERRGLAVDYAELTRLAAEAEPFRSLVDPDDGRFLNPDDMPAALAEFCRESGQPAPESEGQLVRCALESLALKYRVVLGWLEELTGTRVEVIHVVGGGSQNELLNQFTASACGRPVVAGPVEATVLGNVLVQARTAGELGSLAEIRAVVRRSVELKQYEPSDHGRWDEAAARFERLVQ
ncbi:MAG TPA: rhamnulokinase family protein [Planctomycetaceae bacterium]|nr:rhamnulokinase family protein [Planctomycetaceae bacterium]